MIRSFEEDCNEIEQSHWFELKDYLYHLLKLSFKSPRDSTILATNILKSEALRVIKFERTPKTSSAAVNNILRLLWPILSKNLYYFQIFKVL